jgi:phage terminase large subunit-like protein
VWRAAWLAVQAQVQRQRQAGARRWEPLPIQRAPAWDDHGWDVWMLRGSRGSGKTEGASRFVLEYLRRFGRAARVGVGAPTIADARGTCAEGPSGLITLAPQEFVHHRSLGEAWHRAGGYVRFLGAEEPDRWNGPQWSLLWCDELALWPKETYEQAQLGLRLGEHPRTVISTTPKAARWVWEIEQHPRTVVTTGTLAENKYLSETARRRLEELFRGTHLEQRELLGEWWFEAPNALWRQDLFRWGERVPALARVVVAVDPAVTSGPDSAATGIVVVGLDGWDRARARAWVVEDATMRGSPLEWARRVVAAYDAWRADGVVAEVNQGGDLVETTLQMVRPGLPVWKVHATRGKAVRAQPVVALYEQGRVWHVRGLGALERELCGWDPEGGESPNRLDALVWGVSALLVAEAERVVWRAVVGAPVRISRF